MNLANHCAASPGLSLLNTRNTLRRIMARFCQRVIWKFDVTWQIGACKPITRYMLGFRYRDWTVLFVVAERQDSVTGQEVSNIRPVDNAGCEVTQTWRLSLITSL
jgi:hypothetical protein